MTLNKDHVNGNLNRQMNYKSNIGHSILGFILTSVNYLIIIAIIIIVINNFTIPKLNLANSILFITPYLIILYYYIWRTNFDFETIDNGIRVTKKYRPLRKSEIILYKDISKIEFVQDLRQIVCAKHQRNLFEKYVYLLYSKFIPVEYKCVEIITEKRNKYYCFGIEYDQWDMEGPWIEDLYLELHEKGIFVQWINSKDKWAKELNKTGAAMNRSTYR